MMKNKVLWICLLIIIVGAIFMFKSEDTSSKDTITIATMGEPASLDPHKVQGGVWEMIILQDSFVGLMERAQDGSVKPGVAERYKVSPDGKTYTFYLKQTKWSDGEPVTAYDFEFSYKRMLSPEIAAPYAFYLYPIKNAEAYNGGKVKADAVGVKAISDYVLQIDLENPTSYFIISLVHDSYFPVPKHAVEKYGSEWAKPEHIVSNGAYKIVEWNPKSYVKAVKNDLFYDAANTKIQNIIYYTQEDRSAVLKRFRSGEIDIADDFPVEQYEWLKKNMPEETKTYVYNATFYIPLNVNNKDLKNKNVREALSMAIDRDFITEKVLKTGEQPTYSFIPEGLEGYTPAKFTWVNLSKEERIAKAKQLLAEAGYSKKNPLNIELAYTTDENDKKILVSVASMWKDIGVNVTTNTREVNIHYAELQKANFDSARARWVGDYEEPSTFLDLLVSNNGNNYGQYTNKKFDDLVAKAKASLNTKERNQLYNQAEQIALDEVAVIPVFYFVSKTLVNSRVEGRIPNVANFSLVRYMSFKDESK